MGGLSLEGVVMNKGDAAVTQDGSLFNRYRANHNLPSRSQFLPLSRVDLIELQADHQVDRLITR
jgi:hypothetical protein